jgi:hypothetical protein
MIHSFVCRGDSSDALRGVICGIEFGERTFIINTRQLKKIMSRSKSCMNGCFQRLGYSVCRTCDLGKVFQQTLPGAEVRFQGREWCVRRAEESAAVVLSPNLTIEIPVGETEQEAQPDEPLRANPLDISSLLNPSEKAESGIRC